MRNYEKKSLTLKIVKEGFKSIEPLRFNDRADISFYIKHLADTNDPLLYKVKNAALTLQSSEAEGRT